jgi:peptidoglycan hydrolase CwlO-like protein
MSDDEAMGGGDIMDVSTLKKLITEKERQLSSLSGKKHKKKRVRIFKKLGQLNDKLKESMGELQQVKEVIVQQGKAEEEEEATQAKNKRRRLEDGGSDAMAGTKEDGDGFVKVKRRKRPKKSDSDDMDR